MLCAARSNVVGTARRTGYHLAVMKLRGVLSGAFSLSLLGGLAWLWLAPDRLARAPEITVTNLQGNQLSIPTLNGGPMLVTFWSTTCRACLAEMPHLIELHRELAPRGLEIIGIAMAYDPPNRVLAVTRARQIPYPIALDIQSEAARAFGDVRLTPTSFLIAPDGRVIHQETGQLDIPQVRALILDMLGQAALSDESYPSG